MVLEGGIVNLHVKAVQMFDKRGKLKGSLWEPILVRELSGDVEKDQKENYCELFEDKSLKCWGFKWMIDKFSYCSWDMLDSSNPCQDIQIEVHDRSSVLPRESEQLMASCASMGEDSLTGASRIQDEASLDFRSETLESFFNIHPRKIQGQEHEEVELRTMAEGGWLMHLSFGLKFGNASTTVAAIELTKLLLVEPKDLATMYKDSEAFNTGSAGSTSEHIVKVQRYEPQILFRMEILQSEVRASNAKSTKLRVFWSPKHQPKAMKPKSNPLRKLAKRKEQRRASFDVVLDTPMTGN
ncbi:hypothetical protein SADUNF_Sadunf15G0021800 [Salix dunnii]|uniref:Uncharacterized protein n=1 Tax=Salix dunnii TaxID=1413687 RepID=A0A835JDI3_9ROSI|nr:hypothetical protein SADUNF_Sadunf15G0021800 [Salix dunnii]